MLSAISTPRFHLSMLRRFNVWYTVKDGNWNDPNIWRSNGRKSSNLPHSGDDVYINHTVILNISTIGVKNLYISGTLLASSTVVSLTVNGNCQVNGNGFISLSNQFHNLILKAYDNIIPYASFNGGNFSTVTYAGDNSQPILDLPYRHLATTGGFKYQVSSITTLGNFNAQSDYDIGNHSLTIGGTSLIGTVGLYTLSKSGTSGSLLFVGNVDFEGGADFRAGNPNIEFRGGLVLHTFIFYSGTGNVTLTTNNQSINASAQLGGLWNAPITISGAITVTVLGEFSTQSTITGTIDGSTLNNEGILNLYHPTLPMSTGVFNYMHGANSTLGLFKPGNYILPYTTYAGLTIGGNGTKKQAGNTVINKSLNIGVAGDVFMGNIYECEGYNLNVKETFFNRAGFKANSYSTIVFEGMVTFYNGSDASLGVDLSAGNADVEFRNGLYIRAAVVSTGTGVFKFTTNNQTFDFEINNAGGVNCNVLISGAITVTFIKSLNSPTHVINGTINGDNMYSTLINKGILVSGNSQQPMETGILDTNGFPNTFVYAKAGDQDVKSTTYRNLILQGSGAKKLLGNVSVANTYTLTSPTTLNSNGFALTNP